MSKDKSLQLKVDISGNYKDWFYEIKDKYAFPSNAEVVRHTIYTTIEEMRLKKDFTSVELNNLQINRIDKLIQRDDVRQKFNLYNVQQFIYKAMDDLITKIIDERDSILDWDLKTSLAGKEQEVALAYGKCHNKSTTKEITLNEIVEELGWRDIENIEVILDRFVQLSMLDSSILNNIKTYHC